jgi:hypothetical protein
MLSKKPKPEMKKTMRSRKSTVTIDGIKIVIQPINGKENVQEFQRFINTIGG